jgi:hypothetical protein
MAIIFYFEKEKDAMLDFESNFVYGPVWQGSGSSKNGSGSGSSGGVASLVELSRFKKRLAK